jgi:tRNA uridine 5-carbamoylmethylation protein Kti12
MTIINSILIALCLFILLRILLHLKSIGEQLEGTHRRLFSLEDEVISRDEKVECRLDLIRQQIEGMRSDESDILEEIEIIQSGLNLNTSKLREERLKSISDTQRLMEADDDEMEQILDEILPGSKAL